ncbi:MAG: mycofactocin precursor MftA [Actinomycetes bacterium]
MTRTASRVATAAQVRDGDAESAQVTDERDAPDISDVEVDDVLVEEVSIDGLCGVY